MSVVLGSLDFIQTSQLSCIDDSIFVVLWYTLEDDEQTVAHAMFTITKCDFHDFSFINYKTVYFL